MRHGKSTIKEANELISAMQRANVPNFRPSVFGQASRHLIQDMVNKAKRHHSVQEKYCSEDMSDENRARAESVEAGLERDIIEIAHGFGLKVRFGGDPRGFTVRLLAPKEDVYNTWGGPIHGYGIGGAEC
jgi:hypothetical protein